MEPSQLVEEKVGSIIEGIREVDELNICHDLYPYHFMAKTHEEHSKSDVGDYFENGVNSSQFLLVFDNQQR